MCSTFATSGTNALRFTTAAWKKGLPEWPSFELKPAVRDWKGYDRLAVDITNPNEEQYHFALFVSDTNTPIRKGLHQTFAVPSYGYARMIVPLSAFPETVKRSEVATLHFFTERPQTDMTLYLDNITLLKKGETQPEPSPAFVRQMPSLSQNALSAADHALAAIRDATQSFCDTPAAQANAKKQLACLAERLKDLRSDLSSDGLTLAKLNALQTELSGMSNRSERLLSTLRFQQACAKAGLPTGPLLVGVATSMEQIMPRVMPFDLRPAREVAVRLARNEKESVQVVVLPADEALGKVSVHATDLTAYHGDGSWTCVGPDGTPLPTVRLENFRDGLEDFAYVRILEDLVKQRAADTGNPWLAEAKAALAVPESLVKSMTEYSRTPQTLYAWRNRLAELIASAPAPLEPLLK